MVRLFHFPMALALIGSVALPRPVPADESDLRTATAAMTADPYYPRLGYPRLITPQWVGEPGVEAVVVLAIDDMSRTDAYESYLRPILNRLKQIDGRAPVSIMANQVSPENPRLQPWLAEGLSIEVHTIGHPCPILQKGDFAAAARAYHDGVDLIHQIPNNQPVAFRVPCCDSMSSPSPRFYAEIFNKVSPAGHFLTIDSSVFNLFTAADPELPRDLVFDADGRERFRKYIPSPLFVNTIENYPYPYVIGGLCWEFPCIVPSDWEGQNLHQPANPRTLNDLKAALDLVVLKQGVFNLVFHPYGWIRNDQVVELIDHAVAQHGPKVKFLNFREAQQRIDRNLLVGHPLRSPTSGHGGIRLEDRNQDGFLDVLILDPKNGHALSRTWDPKSTQWIEATVPHSEFEKKPSLAEDSEITKRLPPGARWRDERGGDAGLRFVDLDEDGHDDVAFSNEAGFGVYLFDPETGRWSKEVASGPAGAPGALPLIARQGTNNGFFVHSRSLWWQNEDTADRPGHLEGRSFNEILKNLPPTAREPSSALRSIRPRPGFVVELVASEPLIRDPIAFDWGADGRLWVVEMGDYPLGVDGQGAPGGVVKTLEDADGDGIYDRATTFLEGLSFPTGVLPWREGVLIAAAPDIFYAEDRDGDGRADHREVLFTGFGRGNPQHLVNGFELGLDGWIYGANGDSGGKILSTRTQRETSMQGRDFRFRPDTGEFEPESGQTQYGRRRDDWGNWFGNNNPTWAWQYVLKESDVAKNPSYAPPDPRRILEPDTRLYPISRTLARFNDPEAANHVTSANSPTPYRDDLFGPHFASSLFVSEPVHNLVHRMQLIADGSTYRGIRAPGEEEGEFLAASDHWFRPTQLRTGPDGALWIADMYRAVIEHPEWIPSEIQKTLDLRAGDRLGRIYRVFPVNCRPRPIPRLDHLDTRGLVAALESPSGWQRDTAQRLLMHRGDPAAADGLRDLVASTRRPQVRVQACWTLQSLGLLDEASVLTCLSDPHPQVRRNGIELAQPYLAPSPRIAEVVLKLMDDPDPRVRLQLALTLGRWEDPRAGAALAQLALRDPEDPWMRAAILSSAFPHVSVLLGELLRGGAQPPANLLEPLAKIAGSRGDPEAIRSLIRVVSIPAETDGKSRLGRFAALRALLEAARPQQAVSLEEAGIRELLEAARRLARQEEAPELERIQAVELIGVVAASEPEVRSLLLDLIRPQSPSSLQQAAVAALARTAEPSIADLLLGQWRTLSPQVRGSILDAMLSRKAWTKSLLSALEDGCVAAAEIEPSRRSSLLNHPDHELRERAAAVFAGQTQARRDVLEAYRDALGGQGDPSLGRQVFERLCASCHRLGDLGIEVGPDLAAVRDKSPEALLIAILDPNQAFELRYSSFSVATSDGRVLDGMIASETATAVTLRRQEGKEETILRTDIEELVASGKSLMPEGLEKDLSPAQLLDLLAFLAAHDPPPKHFPGNQPTLVHPQDSGTIFLEANLAEIRGDRLVYETQHGNLGFWMAENDRASWSFTVRRPGSYAVWLDWACPAETAGNTLEIAVGTQRLRFEVLATASWDDYSLKKVGNLELTEGTHRLEARVVPPLRNALLDLRRIELRPRRPTPPPAPPPSPPATAGCLCDPPPDPASPPTSGPQR
jgi:putative membrane-bound dehydrogenase-like protein